MQAKIITEGRQAGHFFAMGSIVELLDIPQSDATSRNIFLALGIDPDNGEPLTQALNMSDFEIILD